MLLDPAQEQTIWEYKRFMMVQLVSIWLRQRKKVYADLSQIFFS